MNNAVFLKAGKLFFAAAILAIGIIHIVSGNFPTGLLPVSAALPGRTLLVYVCGGAIIIAGLLMLIKKYAYPGALLSMGVFVVLVVLVHFLLLFAHLKDGGEWTGTFEVLCLISGSLIAAGAALPVNDATIKTRGLLLTTGRYIFAAALLLFGVLHVIYQAYIVTLIPAWFPPQVFWSYVVTVAFFATGINLLIKKQVRLSMLLISLMFFIWVLALHLPRVIGSPKIEPEWTSMFIALAMSGIALLIAGLAVDTKQKAAGIV